jgi:hypothetical protein
VRSKPPVIEYVRTNKLESKLIIKNLPPPEKLWAKKSRPALCSELLKGKGLCGKKPFHWLDLLLLLDQAKSSSLSGNERLKR